ncbi:MAG: TorD/DmsD family molecular chaperone [Acidimicrobiales bacterium]
MSPNEQPASADFRPAGIAARRAGPRSGARAELIRALAALSEMPGDHHRQLAVSLELPGSPTASGHTGALVLGVHPYASVYLGSEGMLGGEAGDRVAGFWRAIGLVPPPEADHLSALLGLYASLLDAEREAENHQGPEQALVDSNRTRAAAASRRARETLLSEHLLSWIPLFCRAVEKAGDETHAAWAGLLLEVVLDEAAGCCEPIGLSAHLEASPGLDREPLSLSDLVDQACTPARTGIVLTRLDLASASRHLGLGLRIGERRYMLRALLEQDPPGTLDWLAAEARSWAQWLTGIGERAGTSANFWAGRATMAAAQWTAAAAEARSGKAVDTSDSEERSPA